jgi:tripartite-type tricarboxylate transporter receptor subunit TctC
MTSERFARPALRVGALSFALVSCGAWSAAFAETYPERPLRMVVGFPAGGGVDTVARVIGNDLSKRLGQPVVVENKPGAAGTRGAADVARSAADGYTLLVTPGGHAIFGAMFKSLPFDTVDSFTWISNVINVPFFVVVPAASEFRTLADLTAKARANPGTIAFGSAGPGTTHHLGVELLVRMTGTKLQHVPYRGDAPLVTALLAGEVQFALATPTLIVDNIKAGKLRALATAANARWPGLPDVPTVEQSLDLKDYDVRTWFGLAGPSGMPKPIVDRLHEEVSRAVATPEVRGRLAVIGGEPAPSTPAEMHDRVAREFALWTRTVDEAGIPKQ